LTIHLSTSKSDDRSKHENAHGDVILTELQGKNLADLHERAAREYVRGILSDRNVVGIALLGGAARGFADKHSDIDLSVFVNSRRFHKLRPGERLWKEWDIDVTIVYYPSALSCEWSQIQRHAYSKALILHDPKGKIRSLLNKKLVFCEEERLDIIIENIMHLGWHGICPKREWRGYLCDLPADLWVRRGDTLSAHFLLTGLVDDLLNILFAYNRSYIPDRKWKLYEAQHLSWTPRGFRDRLEAVLKVNGSTVKEFKRRKTVFQSLFLEIIGQIEKEDIFPKDIYRYFLSHGRDYAMDIAEQQ